MSSIKSSEIIEAILDNLREGAEPIYQKVVVPEVYWIYLHSTDYEEVKHKSDQIVEEAKKALSDEILLMNQAIEDFEKGVVGKGISKGLAIVNRLSGVLRGKPGKKRFLKKRYSQPAQGWQISINPDVENKCLAGNVLIKSILQFRKGVELQGNKTMRLVTMRIDGKKSVTQEVVQESDVNPKETQTQVVHKTTPTAKPETNLLALIHLLTNDGNTTYKMTKNSFAIGRGGTTYWVDLPIMNNSKVSQEHVRIRYDDQNGKFFIKDLSRNGTKLNGKKLKASIEKSDGVTRETEIQTELHDKSKIVLADEVNLEFEIVK